MRYTLPPARESYDANANTTIVSGYDEQLNFWFGRLVSRLGLCRWEELRPGSPYEDLSNRVYKLSKIRLQDSYNCASNSSGPSLSPYN